MRQQQKKRSPPTLYGVQRPIRKATIDQLPVMPSLAPRPAVNRSSARALPELGGKLLRQLVTIIRGAYAAGHQQLRQSNSALSIASDISPSH
jgi:hypothetical protein